MHKMSSTSVPALTKDEPGNLESYDNYIEELRRTEYPLLSGMLGLCLFMSTSANVI